MLVLARKPSEQLVIGNDITVTLLSVRGNSVKLGISAPYSTRIRRGELREPKNDKSADSNTADTREASDESESSG